MQEPILLEIEIPQVSEEVYAKTRKAVEATRAFIAPIRSVSIEDLLAEDRGRGQRRFNHEWVNSSKTMRATVPPEMEVFIDPNAVRIEGSNDRPTDVQKQMIQDAGARFRERLPDAVRSLVVFNMMDPSTISQLEDRWMDVGRGLLLPNYFARTDVEIVRGYDARVGRFGPNDQRRVVDWYRDLGYDLDFAVFVGVLPRKLAA